MERKFIKVRALSARPKPGIRGMGRRLPGRMGPQYGQEVDCPDIPARTRNARMRKIIRR